MDIQQRKAIMGEAAALCSDLIESGSVDIDGDAKIIVLDDSDAELGYCVQAWIFVPKSSLKG